MADAMEPLIQGPGISLCVAYNSESEANKLGLLQYTTIDYYREGLVKVIRGLKKKIAK
jgi:hypothetical protein